MFYLNYLKLLCYLLLLTNMKLFNSRLNNVHYINNDDGSKIIHKCNACIMSPVYETNKKLYIKLKLSEDDGKKLLQFEKDVYELLKKDSNITEKIQYSVYNNTIVIKVPYRYKKFEVNIISNDDLKTMYDIKQNDNVTVDILPIFSKQDECMLCTWKLETIKI